MLKESLEEKVRKCELEITNLIDTQRQLVRTDKLERKHRRNNAIVTSARFTIDNGRAIVVELLSKLDDPIRPAETSCLKTPGAAKYWCVSMALRTR